MFASDYVRINDKYYKYNESKVIWKLTRDFDNIKRPVSGIINMSSGINQIVAFKKSNKIYDYESSSFRNIRKTDYVRYKDKIIRLNSKKADLIKRLLPYKKKLKLLMTNKNLKRYFNVLKWLICNKKKKIIVVMNNNAKHITKLLCAIMINKYDRLVHVDDTYKYKCHSPQYPYNEGLFQIGSYSTILEYSALRDIYKNGNKTLILYNNSDDDVKNFIKMDINTINARNTVPNITFDTQELRDILYNIFL